MILALISDQRFDSLTSVMIGGIAVVPGILAAIYAKGAQRNSREANDNSAEAKSNSAKALHEVSTNGGMSDPNPNLNDHIKYQTDMVREISAKVEKVQGDLHDHLRQSKVMEQALADLYLAVRPDPINWPDED